MYASYVNLIYAWRNWTREQTTFFLPWRFPVVSLEPFKQLAQLATHLEKLKPAIMPILTTFIKEEDMPHVNLMDCDMIKLEEDGILCGFNPWFRGLDDWTTYRRYAPKSIPPNLCQVIGDYQKF